MSEWQNVYRRFVRLERSWSVHDYPGVNRQLFHSAVLSRRSEAEVQREFASFKVASLPSALWKEARELRALLDFPHRGRSPDDACDDVYQAALTMMPFGEWTSSESHEKLYRGQRDIRWRVTPGFFRNSPDQPAFGVAEVNALANAIMNRRPELQAGQALALIQHYSKELNAKTWLIDLTWDPAVALFFASDEGRTGDIGVVTMLVRREWEKLAAGGRNRLGQIRLIEVPDVLRIKRQRALFLDTSHPDLLEQYVAHSVWFRQVDDLVFEDTDADWPVSKERCYPDRDPTLDLLRGLNVVPDAGAPEPGLVPPSDALQPLRAHDYLEIARSWCEEEGVALDPGSMDVLSGVCEIHSQLQKHRDILEIPLRSLHRLQEATRIVIHAQQHGKQIDVSNAVTMTLQRTTTDAERELLQSIVKEFAHPAGLGGAVASLPAFVKRTLADLTPHLAELVVIGAADASVERVERDLEAVLADKEFRVFDLRGAPELRGVGALATDIGDAVRLLLIDGKTAPNWIHRLTRAFLDGKECVVFEQGRIDRPEGRSVVIVQYGVREIEDLAPILREPIVQFIA